MSSVQVKQFRTSSGARSEAFLSYCIYEVQSREAMIVDSHLSALTDYVEFLNNNRLKLQWIVETQCHFSHPTAAHSLSKQFQAQVAMSEATESALVDRKLRSGETLGLGNLKITALLTPGIRPDSLCLFGPQLLFTGETLWLGASSGFGLPKSYCKTLFDSLQLLKKNGKPEDIVFSGYDVQGLCFSRWKVELEKNPDLLAKNVDELKILKTAVPVRLAEDFQAYAEFNSRKSPQTPSFLKSERFFHTENIECERPGYSTISAEKFSHKVETLIDVREPEEFSQGHVPGSKNIPLSELVSRVDELAKFPRVYLSCLSGKRSALAASTLSYIGIQNVIMLVGGYQAWQNAGLPTQK